MEWIVVSDDNGIMMGSNRDIHGYIPSGTRLLYKTLLKIIIVAGQTHYFYGHVQKLCNQLQEGVQMLSPKHHPQHKNQ